MKFYNRSIAWGVLLCLIVGSFGPACSNRQVAADKEGKEGEKPTVESSVEILEGIPPETVGAEPLEAVPSEITEGEPVQTPTFRWRVPESDLPVVLNKHVFKWMNYFTGRGRVYFEKWLERKPQVEAMMTRVLEEYNLPKDLIYLSMIESGFNTKAYSHARAAGPWQFMKATGKLYGLRADNWIDERRDPEKSTDAAARHLRDLYQRYGDWYLVASAYNAGAGKVDGAIRRHGTKNYWQLIEVKRPHLRSETRNYVPKMLAALIIGKQPEAFGFIKPPPAIPETVYDTVTIEDATDLHVIARSANADPDIVKALNPEILFWFTPPGYPDYTLRIPAGTKETFGREFAALPPEERVTFREHTLKHGETVGQIAKRYHTTSASIMQLNKLSSFTRLKTGRVLFIPIRKDEDVNQEAIAQAAVEEKPKRHRGRSRGKSSGTRSQPTERVVAAAPANTKTVRHTVASGETLWALSMKYDVSIQAIKKWNAIKRGSKIHPGDVLTIYIKDVS